MKWIGGQSWREEHDRKVKGIFILSKIYCFKEGVNNSIWKVFLKNMQQAIFIWNKTLFLLGTRIQLSYKTELTTLIYWAQAELVLGIIFIFSEPQTRIV